MQKTQMMTPVNQAAWTIKTDRQLPWPRLLVRTSQMLVDIMLAFLAFRVAYVIRYQYEIGGEVMPWDFRTFADFQDRALLFAGLAFAILMFRGIYWLPRSTGLLDETVMLIGGLTTAMAGVILTAFLTRFVPSRLLFIYAWALAIIFFVLRRIISRSIRAAMWRRGKYVDRVIVVGASESGRRIMEAMLNSPALGYQLVGWVDDLPGTNDLSVATERRVYRAQRLGLLDDMERLVERHRVGEVIVALPAEQLSRVPHIVEQCQRQAVRFKVVPDLLQLSLDQIDVGEVAGLPLIGLKPPTIQGGQLFAKRGIDVLVASAVLAVGLIPMFLIAVAVRLTSEGPILFRQTRVGKEGRNFTLVKFRCMFDGAHEQHAEFVRLYGTSVDPRLFKLRDDPRLTTVGRLLRRWSLDELPQFWHVLTGDMSLVGPRPQIPSEVAVYDEWHRQRLKVTPGLTGLWQVNGRSNLSFDEMVRLDLYYAEHWSPWLDIKIVLRTVPAVLLGRGAY